MTTEDSQLPITWTFLENRKKFELSQVRVIRSLKQILTGSKQISKKMRECKYHAHSVQRDGHWIWTEGNKKVTKKNWHGCFEINSVLWTSVQWYIVFFCLTCHDLLKTWFELLRVKLRRNNLKGNKNYFELAGGSSYRGFELMRVRLQ